MSIELDIDDSDEPKRNGMYRWIREMVDKSLLQQHLIT